MITAFIPRSLEGLLQLPSLAASSLAPMWPLLDATETTELKWLSLPPAWLLFLIVLAFGVVFLALYLKEASPIGTVRRVFLAGLRTTVVLGILLVLGNLVAATVREEARESFVLVLVDNSVSMSLMDRYASDEFTGGVAKAAGIRADAVETTDRLELVRRALSEDEGAILAGLATKNRLKLYSFGRRLTAVGELAPGGDPKLAGPSATPTAGTPEGAPDAGAPASALANSSLIDHLALVLPKDGETAIGDSLNRALNQNRGRRVAAIVLITDGRSNAGLLPPLKVARRLQERGIPLFTVGVGNPDEPKDIALSELTARDVVIAGDLLSVKVSIKSQGFEEGGDVQVDVYLDDDLVHQEPVTLQGQGARQEVGLQIQPDRIGEYTLSVEVKPQRGELLDDNNRVSQRLQVVDKKIRVLVIDRRRYEYHWLKTALTRDANMEVQTFQVDSSPQFPHDHSATVEALTQIPGTKEELFTYHVIVLGDVDPNDPALAGKLPLIRDFVEQGGGGLMLMAGPRAMPALYTGSTLEPLVPVTIEPPILGSRRPNLTQTFSPVLTLDGKKHPIMQLENGPEQNLATWATLPGFYWHYIPKGIKPTTQVLATHPSSTTTRQQKPTPLFAIQQVGAGTVFYSGVDEVWRWRPAVGDKYTYRFFGQAIRHLATGRLVKSARFGLSTDQATYELRDRIQIEAEVNDRNLTPSEDESHLVYYETQDGRRGEVELKRPPNLKGVFRGSLLADKVGTLKLWIGAGSADDASLGEDLVMRIVQIQVPVLEKADPKMDERLLRKMALTTEGDYMTLATLAGLPSKIGSVRDVFDVRVAESPLWDQWRVLAGLVLLLGVEWFLRKRWKMW